MTLLDPTRMVDLVEGRFGKTNREDLRRAFAAIDAPDAHVVLHVHGGLVSRKAALNAVATLDTALDTEASVPLYVLWNSGPLRTLLQNLDEIATDLFAVRLRAHILSLVEKWLDPSAGLLDEEAAVHGMAEGLRTDEAMVQATYRVTGINAGLATPTLVSRAIVLEIRPSGEGAGLAGVNWIALARFAVGVAKRVIRRRRAEPAEAKRPLLVTVMEEVFRGFYLDAVGGSFWTALKNDTREAFDPHPLAGGSALMEELAAWWTPQRRVSFVGHSTGAVFFCHMLAHWHKLHAECKVDAILLAPACTFGLLHRTLSRHGDHVAQLRVFGLSDEREHGYSEIPIAYPASLLYLVSGLAESEPDTPIVGMERYWTEPFRTAQYPEIRGLRDWFESRDAATVWAPSMVGPGLDCQADTHSAVGKEPVTLASVRFLLENPSWPAGAGLGVETAMDVVELWRSASRSYPIPRRQPRRMRGGKGFRAAVTKVDLTRELYQSSAGYGIFNARRVEGWHSRLEALLALFEDDRGERALLVAADLHAGSRYLTEALAWALSDLGLSIDRIAFCSSHTHSGTGRLYGTPLYDRIAGKNLFEGFDVHGAKFVLDRLVGAVRPLEASLAPARLGVGTSDAWGLFWQRSLDAHAAQLLDVDSASAQEVHEAVEQAAAKAHPGGTVPDLPAEYLAVDARVRTLTIAPDTDGAAPWGVVAFASGTPTLSPYHVALYSGDVFAAAARSVERAYASNDQHPHVAVVGGANGDVNLVPRDWEIEPLQRARNELSTQTDEPRSALARRATAVHLVRTCGEALGSHIRDAVSTSNWSTPSRLEVRFIEPIVPKAWGPLEAEDTPAHLGSPPVHQRTYELALSWRVGQSTFAAAELNRPWTSGPPKPSTLERSARRRADAKPLLQKINWSDPHSPKERKVDLGPLSNLQQEWFTAVGPLGPLGMDPFLPLHALSFDDLHVVTTPVELSVGLARQIRSALGMGDSLFLASIAGGYTGYASTVGEYVVHDYEGASSYWGRHLGGFVRQQVQQLMASPPVRPGQGATGEALFVRNRKPVDDIVVEEEEDDAGLAAPPMLRVFNDALEDVPPAQVMRLTGDWKPKKRPRGRSMLTKPRPLIAGSWFVRLCRQDGTPIKADGVPVDDLHHEFAVWFDKKQGRWVFVVELPAGAVDGGVTFAITSDHPSIQPRGGSQAPVVQL